MCLQKKHGEKINHHNHDYAQMYVFQELLSIFYVTNGPHDVCAEGFLATVRTRIGTPMECLKSEESMVLIGNDLNYTKLMPDYRVHPCFRQ